MESIPVDLQRDGGSGLLITWSDGKQLRYRASELRFACPCATCREKETGKKAATGSMSLPVLSAAEAKPLTIERMRPVGNYAYNIAFSDGHDSGIFTFDILYELGTENPTENPANQ